MDNSNRSQLTVQGQSLQALYAMYREGLLLVNRRYQRKLVWSVDEKESLIESVVQNYPIPLVLLAEASGEKRGQLEIVDGLQRLNAIFAYIENEFALDGEYFDLTLLADTKNLLDAKKIVQRTPIAPRDVCTRVTNYQLPVSTYRASSVDIIDEVFRRINSSGRKLSDQDIRQAGATSQLANIVRKLGAAIRGDATYSDLLDMRQVPDISISDSHLNYGIDVENIFWVKNAILRADDVRVSKDEEFILDLVVDVLSPDYSVSGTSYRNDAYLDSERVAELEGRVNAYGQQELMQDFIMTYSTLKSVVDEQEHTWSSWVVGKSDRRPIPRYYQAIFVPLFELLAGAGMVVHDDREFAEGLHDFWKTLNIPYGGGNWSKENKAGLFSAIKGRLSSYLDKSDDPAVQRAQAVASEFETNLRMCVTEESMFELKQGFLRLNGEKSGEFDRNSFDKVMRTATAMSNAAYGEYGHIFFGVADDQNAADAISRKYDVEPFEYAGYYVVGTRHELDSLGGVDGHVKRLTDIIRNSSKIDKAYADSLASSLTYFQYGKGYLIWSLRPPVSEKPVSYDGEFYVRRGNSTVLLKGDSIFRLGEDKKKLADRSKTS